MNKVNVYTKQTTIPSYEASAPTELPMFLNKRVYHGSSGRIYPHPIVESVSQKRVDKEYTAIYLENDYLLVVILPELGGRVQRILDKTNNYDAVYYNKVIKPALIGLTGPWISGGIEFSWPLFHRPTTHLPLDYTIEEHDDGSATVWVSEIEQMFHTKGMAGFTLYPDKAYLEVRGQIYNPNDVPKTFMWWANPCVPLNDDTESVFPPDVHIVGDHHKRNYSKFPVATGMYYETDYSAGVDISRGKNIPIPTSYAAFKSDYDFIGSYDHSIGAGLLHIADHHIAPGKKQWTCGCGEYGKAWERSFSDDGGHYVELMAGVYSSDQPDFTYIAPYEEKTFRQFFVPYKGVGRVKNASLRAMLNLEVKDGKAYVTVYSPSVLKCAITLSGGMNSYFRDSVTLDPTHPYERVIELENEDIEDETRLLCAVRDADDKPIVWYSPLPQTREKLPKPEKRARKPEDIPNVEELFLAATHLEQNQHASFSPEPYYLEGLKRSPDDIRLNNGYGKFLYNRGEFERAARHFKTAIKKSTMYNNNPYDCEPFYNLGIALKRLGRLDEAYDAFYKSVWDARLQDRGYYQLACICAGRGRYGHALEFLDQALIRGTHNIFARDLKTACLRHLGHIDEALDFAYETRKIDPLDTACRYEIYKLTKEFEALNDLTTLMRANLHNYLELSLLYAQAGLYADAGQLLALISETERPMLHYYMAYYSNSDVELEIAAKCRDIVFPNRLYDIAVLEYAIKNNPSDPLAPYLLGCLMYDRGRSDDAIKYWELSLEKSPREAATHRNLALAYYNKRHDAEKAMTHMERARRFAPDSARIYYEYDRLRKITNVPIKKRLKDYGANMELVEQRDDLVIEYVTMLNELRYHRTALKTMEKRNFRLMTDTEGRITVQYRKACIGAARDCIAQQDYEGAAEILKSALIYPENLGESRIFNSPENDINYLLGEAYEKTDLIEAMEYYRKATVCPDNFASPEYTDETPPEMYFYSALAMMKAGHEEHAVHRFRKLINYSEAHIDDVCEIDYFAESLREYLIFEADLDRNNFVRCCYMGALGYTGLGDTDKAMELITAGLERDASHQGLLELRDMDEKPVETDEVVIEGGYFKAASW